MAISVDLLNREVVIPAGRESTPSTATSGWRSATSSTRPAGGWRLLCAAGGAP